VLYQVVRDHVETFRAEAARIHERDGLPRFIEEEFRGFLRCGFRSSVDGANRSYRPFTVSQPSLPDARLHVAFECGFRRDAPS
jgi:hypothetical protein